MLELRPICENCGKKLPADSTEAMICSFECTFCATCVGDVLENALTVVVVLRSAPYVLKKSG